MGTRSKHIENYMKNEKQHKHLIFILNKCDLVPTWVTVSFFSMSFLIVLSSFLCQNVWCSAMVSYICQVMDRVWSYMDRRWSYIDRLWSYIDRLWSYINRLWSYIDRLWSYIDRIWSYIDRLWSYMDRLWSYMTIHSCTA